MWSLVEQPLGANVIGSKWVFKVKYASDGSIDRFKARLVAQGYNQKHGIDFFDVFAPVVSYEAVRCVLSLAASMNFEIHQADIKTAFLNGTLEETIYMRQPPGFTLPGLEHLVCKLERSLYGLKQSPRQWNKVLDSYLKESGFTPSLCEPCIYIRGKLGNPDYAIISVFVDDLLLFSPTTDELTKIKKSLSSRFDVTDLGEIHYFLGIEVTRDRPNRKIYLRQPKYIDETLERFNMSDSHPAPIPILPKEHLPPASELPPESEATEIPYRHAVGCLLHLMTATRPDISYAVNAVSQHMKSYRKIHWEAVKRILRYLKGTCSYALCLGGTKPIRLTAFADGDCANSPDRKSITGYFFSLGDGAFGWKSQKQSIVASSTTEAECISLWAAAKHAEHLVCLLNELGISQNDPIVC